VLLVVIFKQFVLQIAFLEGVEKVIRQFNKFALLSAMAALLLTPSFASADNSDPAQNPNGIKAGDEWTYDITDDITGDLKFTDTYVVTEATDKEITTRMTRRGSPNTILVVFDANWDLMDNSLWRRKPHGGEGIDLPLTVGKTWHVSYNSQNLKTGIVLREQAMGKVTGQESVTTSAGTFDTFKIATQVRAATSDPTVNSQTNIVTWFAPSINRWVKRTTATVIKGHVATSFSEELIEFSRRS
jgi:hypothetical protein